MEHQSQHKSQPTKSPPQVQPLSEETRLEWGMVTPDNVLHLQRTVGNKAVQRLLNGKNPTPLIQRAPNTETQKEGTGIQQSAPIEQYVTAVRAFADSPVNADKPISELLNVMAGQLYIALATVNVPQPSVVIGNADGNVAQFSSDTWNITVDPNIGFAGATTVRELRDKGAANQQDLILEAASTIYHEGRHSKQDFRIAQMLAGNWINKGDEGNEDARKRAADSIQAKTGTRLDVALQATLHPLREGEVDKAIWDEAKAWYRSMYGVDASYRNLVYELKPLAIELHEFATNLDTEISNSYLLSPADKQNFEQNILPQRLAQLNQRLDKILPYRDNQVQNEMNRINQTPLPRRTPNSAVMLRHLSNMSIYLMKIRDSRPADNKLQTVHDAAINIAWFSEPLKKTLEQADVDLPEQADAFATEAKLAEVANKTP